MPGIQIATWPTNRKDAFEDKWRQMANRLGQGNGVFRSIANDEFEVSATGVDGMKVFIGTGECWIDGEFGYSDTPAYFTLDAADSTYTRYDTVVLRLDRTAPAWIYLDIVKGNPSANPVPHSLRDDATVTEMEIGRVAVHNGVSTLLPIDAGSRRRFIGNIPWTKWDFEVGVGDGGGTAPTILTDPANPKTTVSEFKVVDGDLCFVRWGQWVQRAGTDGYDYVVTLPFEPMDTWDTGKAIVQNHDGHCVTVVREQTIGPGVSVAMDQVNQKVVVSGAPPYTSFSLDNGLFTPGPGTTYDRFTLTYRIRDDTVRL